MISSINNADRKDMTTSIMSTKSCLMDKSIKFHLTTEQQTSIKSQKNEKQIEIITNAFKELYNNYYNIQKQKTTKIEQQNKIDKQQENKNNEIKSILKKSIETIFHPTEHDKKPNPKKENKSNYDISLENFNNYVNDICKKYTVKNIGDLVQTLENTKNEKFARHIQSFLMCCAARETQEMFMGNDLSLAMF